MKYDDFGVLLDHCKDFALTHHDQFFTINLNGVTASVLTKYNHIADLYSQGAQLTAIEYFAIAYCNDFTLVGYLYSLTLHQDTACGGCFFFLATNDPAVVLRPASHLCYSPM